MVGDASPTGEDQAAAELRARAMGQGAGLVFLA